FKLARKIFTQSSRARGETDPFFDLLQQHNFRLSPNSVASSRVRSSSPIRRTQVLQEQEVSATCCALFLSDTQIPVRTSFRRMEAQPVPWGAAIGPLSLTPPLYDLPHGSHKNISMFNGDGKHHPNEHITSFFVACGILGVSHEDISVRLFVETLHGVAAEWFYHLPNACITNWTTMRSIFEARFKPAEDSHALLAQLTHMKKESYEPMQDFIAKFNKLIRKIPELAIPTLENQ
ncbi:hypothetical protein KI387_041885, partial [Taxus chinensis]